MSACNAPTNRRRFWFVPRKWRFRHTRRALHARFLARLVLNTTHNVIRSCFEAAKVASAARLLERIYKAFRSRANACAEHRTALPERVGNYCLPISAQPKGPGSCFVQSNSYKCWVWCDSDSKLASGRPAAAPISKMSAVALQQALQKVFAQQTEHDDAVSQFQVSEGAAAVTEAHREQQVNAQTALCVSRSLEARMPIACLPYACL